MTLHDLRTIEPLTAADAFALTAGLTSSRQRVRAANSAPGRTAKAANAKEVVFEITHDLSGGFCAKCRREDLVVQAETWDKLGANIRQTVRAFCNRRSKHGRIRLHLVRDEIFALGQASR